MGFRADMPSRGVSRSDFVRSAVAVVQRSGLRGAGTAILYLLDADGVGRLNYRMAPIAEDGARTATYDLVKTVTSEIQRLSGVFLGARGCFRTPYGDVRSEKEPFG